jgi:hypothetical protein
MDRRWFQYGSGCGSFIFGQYGSELMNQQFEHFTAKKLHIHLIKKLQYIYPLASMEDIQAPGEASSTQKKRSITSKQYISSVLLWFSFVRLDPDPDQIRPRSKSMRIYTEPGSKTRRVMTKTNKLVLVL